GMEAFPQLGKNVTSHKAANRDDDGFYHSESVQGSYRRNPKERHRQLGSAQAAAGNHFVRKRRRHRQSGARPWRSARAESDHEQIWNAALQRRFSQSAVVFGF